jgi:hypothetical protein
MGQSKRYITLVATIIFIIVGFVLVLNFVVFADTAGNGFKLYRLSQFPNLYDQNKQIDYKNIDLGKTEEAKEITLKIPRGETEGFTILLKNDTNQPVNDLTIDKADFTNSDGVNLSSRLIDERVIHVWPTKQYSIKNKKIIWKEDRDELLVKNDKIDFLSNDISTTVDSQLKSQEDTISADIDARASKKFYIKVTAPADQGGLYTSNISFVDKTLDKKLISLKINLEILDLDLINPSQAKNPYTIGCFNNDRIKVADSDSLRGGEQYISEELFKTRMKIAKDYGCESMIQRVGPYADNIRALEIFSQLGYKGPIILNHYYFKTKADGINYVNYDDTLSTQASKNDFRNMIREIKNDKKITVPINFYGIDEPNDASGQELYLEKTANLDKLLTEELGSEINRSNIQRVFSAAMSARAAEYFDQIGKKATLPIVAFPTWPNYLSLINTNTISDDQTRAFYYQGFMEYPLSNRYLNGFGLANSGMRGSFSNPLYGYTSTDSKPLYDDFKSHDNDFGYNTWRKPMMSFYPASDGFIPTYQVEGHREGVNDLKYYLTYSEFKGKKNECKNSARLSILESSIDRKFKKFKMNITNPYAKPSVSSVDYDDLRESIKSYLSNYQKWCNNFSEDLPSGFKAVGGLINYLPNQNVFLNQELYQFKAGEWNKLSDGQLNITSGEGYYIKNKIDQTKVKITGIRSSTLKTKLIEGWNLLYSEYPSDLTELRTVIGSGDCKKIVPLSSLTKLGSPKSYASKIIPIVNNATANTADEAFKYLGIYNSGKYLKQIPKGKNFWFYLFTEPDPNSSDFSSYPCL